MPTWNRLHTAWCVGAGALFAASLLIIALTVPLLYYDSLSHQHTSENCTGLNTTFAMCLCGPWHSMCALVEGTVEVPSGAARAPFKSLIDLPTLRRLPDDEGMPTPGCLLPATRVPRLRMRCYWNDADLPSSLQPYYDTGLLVASDTSTTLLAVFSVVAMVALIVLIGASIYGGIEYCISKSQ